MDLNGNRSWYMPQETATLAEDRHERAWCRLQPVRILNRFGARHVGRRPGATDRVHARTMVPARAAAMLVETLEEVPPPFLMATKRDAHVGPRRVAMRDEERVVLSGPVQVDGR